MLLPFFLVFNTGREDEEAGIKTALSIRLVLAKDRSGNPDPFIADNKTASRSPEIESFSR